ncbi:MAG: exodeoxyribonuclease VII small subunit [Clostridiales bacterium]|nr:exodeoxyribonuclease VII small subunit [Clostridiales bacterium]
MEKFDYEKAVNRLEEIAKLLEKSDLTLEENIKLYTEGMKLCKKCSDEISKAELKITQIKALSETV